MWNKALSPRSDALWNGDKYVNKNVKETYAKSSTVAINAFRYMAYFLSAYTSHIVFPLIAQG